MDRRTLLLLSNLASGFLLCAGISSVIFLNGMVATAAFLLAAVFFLLPVKGLKCKVCGRKAWNRHSRPGHCHICGTLYRFGEDSSQ